MRAHGAYPTKEAADQAAALLGVTTTGAIAIRTLALTQPRHTVDATLRGMTPARIAVVPQECADLKELEAGSDSWVSTQIGPAAVWILGSTPSMIGRGDALIGALIGPFESTYSACAWVRTAPQLPGQSLHALVVALQNTTALTAEPISSGIQGSTADATWGTHDPELAGVVIARLHPGTWHACGPFADEPTAATYLQDVNSALNLINRTHHGALAVHPPIDGLGPISCQAAPPAQRHPGEASTHLGGADTRPHIVLLIHDDAALDDSPRTEYELTAFGWFPHPATAHVWLCTQAFPDGSHPIIVRVDEP